MLPSLYYDGRWKEIEASQEAEFISQKFKLPIYLAKHLASLVDLDELEDFLSPSGILSPIPGTQEVAARLDQAIGEKKRILLFGDYDVDGLSSLALMVSFLRLNGVEPLYYVPSRYKEGYGLTKKALESLPDADLVITFDCGTTAVEEVQLLKARGVEVLITDHHQPGDKLPDCPIMNPQLAGDFKELAGVGVAYKLALYLAQAYGYEFSQDLLAFAMLGTISDLMPLVGENRFIVKEGLKIFETTELPGLRALRQGVKGTIDCQYIGFRIGPMLNAAGRLGEATEALELLLGQGDLEGLVEKLLHYNEERKKEEAQVVSQAKARVNREDPVVLVQGSWKKGVLGLAASRLASSFRKPAIVLDGSLTGSSRSVGNFSIIDALRSSAQHLEHFGGHLMAAGLSVKEDELEDFKSRIFDYTRENFDFLETRQRYDYIALEAGDINLGLLDELELLAPYGVANPQLTFKLEGLEYLETRRLGTSGRAFLVTFKAGDRRFEFLLFDEKLAASLKKTSYDLLFTVEKDLFRDILSIKLLLKDIRPSRPSLEYSTLFLPFYEGLASSIGTYRSRVQDFLSPVYEEDRIYKLGDREFPRDFPHPHSFKGEDRAFLGDLPGREDLVKIYTWLKKQDRKFSWSTPKRPLLAMISLKIFEELELISYTNRDRACYYKINKNIGRSELEESQTYRKVLAIKEDMNEPY